MKARGGWREKHEVEATVTPPSHGFVWSPVPPLTREQWLERQAARRLAAETAGE